MKYNTTTAKHKSCMRAGLPYVDEVLDPSQEKQDLFSIARGVTRILSVSH